MVAERLPVWGAVTAQRFLPDINQRYHYIGRIWRVGETGEVGSDLAEVIYIGGGAYYFAEVVGDTLDTVVRRTATPELDNARGYKVFGDYLERQRAW